MVEEMFDDTGISDWARLETDGSLLVEKQALSKDQNIFVCTGSG